MIAVHTLVVIVDHIARVGSQSSEGCTDAGGNHEEGIA